MKGLKGLSSPSFFLPYLFNCVLRFFPTPNFFKPMEHPVDQVAPIEDSSSSHTTSASVSHTAPLQFHAVMFKNIACSPAVLLGLSLATYTINKHTYTLVLFQWLAIIVLLSCICIIFSGHLVTLLIYFIERQYFIERHRIVKKNVKHFYVVFALRTSLRYLIGSTSLLFSWYVLAKPDMTISVRRLVTNTLATCVIAAVMWMLKTVILKELNCHFHDKNFWQNMRDLISNEYFLLTLLGFSSMGSKDSNNTTWRTTLKYIKTAVMLLFGCGKLRTICDQLENTDSDRVENNISLVVQQITSNEHRVVQEADLLAVMEKEALPEFLRLFDGGEETKSISQDSVRNWMIKVCNDREHAVQLLNSSSEVIKKLNINVLVIQSHLVVFVWCLLMGVGTTKSLVYFSAYLLVFGYYCKIIFNGAMLAIVMHPFDRGDHCIIDDEQLVVKEIGLISTDFLKDNNENKNFPNSVLLTKSISNLNRSSKLEIIVSSTTSSETIASLELKIDELVRSKPETWDADHCFDLKGIDGVTHIYNLQIIHATNFQNYKEKKYQRSELVHSLRKLLEELNIKDFTINQ